MGINKAWHDNPPLKLNNLVRVRVQGNLIHLLQALMLNIKQVQNEAFPTMVHHQQPIRQILQLRDRFAMHDGAAIRHHAGFHVRDGAGQGADLFPLRVGQLGGGRGFDLAFLPVWCVDGDGVKA